MASAYRWAERHLAGDADWRRGRRLPRRYLREWTAASVGRAARECFASPRCWDNYKAIEATGVLLLLDTGLPPASPAARLAHPRRARAAALSVLRDDFPRESGGSGETRGEAGTLPGVGVIRDVPSYPLAYHAMSAAAVARGLELLGPSAPPAAREAFRRAMLTEASFMAPDADVTYMGRAQGQVWALGATAYAGEACARMFQATHPRTAGICATLATRAVQRLKRLHGFRHGLLSIVPRLRYGPPSAAGLEHYARVMSVNGLTAMFLEWAGDAARGARRVRPAALPLDAGGSFADHGGSGVAVVRRPSVWFATHATGPTTSEDIRYGFGLLALKVRRGDHWADVLPPRPLLPPAEPLGGAGVALVTTAGLAVPRISSFGVDTETGTVTMRGDFRTSSGSAVQRGAVFRFTPQRGGVLVSATVAAGSTLRLQDFLPDGWTRATNAAQVLETPTAASQLSEPPASFELGLSYASGYSTRLRGFRRYVTVPDTGRVSWTLSARPRAAVLP
jgi:hypothetical protein